MDEACDAPAPLESQRRFRLESRTLLATLLFLGVLAAALEWVDARRHDHQRVHEGAMPALPTDTVCDASALALPRTGTFELLIDARTSRCLLILEGVDPSETLPPGWSDSAARTPCPPLRQYWRPSTSGWCSDEHQPRLEGGCVGETCMWRDPGGQRWFARWTGQAPSSSDPASSSDLAGVPSP